MYSDRFNFSTVEVETSVPVMDEDKNPVVDESGNKVYENVVKTYDVKNLRMVHADLYLVSLAILADIEDKEAHSNARNSGFLKGYRQHHNGVSLETVAKRVVGLYDSVQGEDYAPEMFYSWKRWGRGRMGKLEGKRVFISDTFDETTGYDPYVFSQREKTTSLSQASMTLLAKGLRFFLEETLRHFYLKSDPNDWYPYTDKKGKRVVPECGYQGTRTSASFNSSMSELLKLFDGVYLWTPHLEEFTEATSRAVEAGHVERASKDAARHASIAGNRTYGKAGERGTDGDNKPYVKKSTAPVTLAETKKPKVSKVTVVDDDGWVTTVKKSNGEDLPSQSEA